MCNRNIFEGKHEKLQDTKEAIIFKGIPIGKMVDKTVMAEVEDKDFEMSTQYFRDVNSY